MLGQHHLNIVVCKMLQKKKKKDWDTHAVGLFPKRQTAIKSFVKNEKDN